MLETLEFLKGIVIIVIIVSIVGFCIHVLLLHLFKALDSQDNVLLSVFKIFQTLISQGQVIINLGKFFSFKLVKIFYWCFQLIIITCILILLEFIPFLLYINFFPCLKNSLKQLTCPLIFFLIPEINTNSLNDTNIIILNTVLQLFKILLILFFVIIPLGIARNSPYRSIAF